MVGGKGDIVTVKPGYARNFLIPQKFAREINRKEVAQVTKEKEERQTKLQQKEGLVEEFKSKLAKKRITVQARITSAGNLYAALSTDAVTGAIYKTYGVTLRSDSVHFAAPIKTAGMHGITVDFGEKGSVAMKLRVVAE